jgi:hypothetical protein
VCPGGQVLGAHRWPPTRLAGPGHCSQVTWPGARGGLPLRAERQCEPQRAAASRKS